MPPPTKVLNRPIMRANQPTPGTGFVPVSRWVDCIAISATAASYTIPTGVAMVRLTPTTAALPAYGSVTGTAAAPAATTTGTGSFPIPAGLAIGVNPGDVLSVVGAAAGFLSIECWQ